MANQAVTSRRLISEPFRLSSCRTTAIEEESVARVTRLVCDNCGKEVEEAKGAVMRINFTDATPRLEAGRLCDACAGKMPGQAVARRGPSTEVCRCVDEFHARSVRVHGRRLTPK